MSHLPERRDFRRLYVGSEYTVRFSVNGYEFSGIRLTNLSAGGCFAVVPKSHAGLFKQGAILENFGLEHPDLPKQLFSAEVRYALGSASTVPGMEFLGIGIAFNGIPEEVRQALSIYLDLTLGPE